MKGPASLPDGGTETLLYLPMCELTELLSLIDGWAPVGPFEMRVVRHPCTE